jgi:hypothetical protein
MIETILGIEPGAASAGRTWSWMEVPGAPYVRASVHPCHPGWIAKVTKVTSGIRNITVKKFKK